MASLALRRRWSADFCALTSMTESTFKLRAFSLSTYRQVSRAIQIKMHFTTGIFIA